MDKLIEDYKKQLINDSVHGFGYSYFVKKRIIKDINENNIVIPIMMVQEMINKARIEGV